MKCMWLLLHPRRTRTIVLYAFLVMAVVTMVHLHVARTSRQDDRNSPKKPEGHVRKAHAPDDASDDDADVKKALEEAAAAATKKRSSPKSRGAQQAFSLDELSQPVTWPSYLETEEDRTAHTWIFVYCDEPGSNILRAKDTVRLVDVLSAALLMDTKVLVCDPNHDDNDDKRYHPHLFFLPSLLQRWAWNVPLGVYNATEGARPEAQSKPPSAVLPSGFLLALKSITSRLRGKRLLLLSPHVWLGADVLGTLQKLRNQLKPSEEGDVFDTTVLTPKILYLEGQEETPALTPEDLRALPIFAQGFMVAEVDGMQSTLYPRLQGMHSNDSRALHIARVQVPSSLVALFPMAHLRDRIEVETAPDAAGTPSQPLSHPFGAQYSMETTVLLSLAALALPRVLAVPVDCVYIAPEQSRHVEEVTEIARGGKYDAGAGISPSARMASILPPSVSQNVHLHRMVVERYDEKMAGVTVYWDPYCSCTGINIEAINFLTSLEKFVRTRAVATADCFCPHNPASDEAALARMRLPKSGSGSNTEGSSSSGIKQVDMTSKVVWVSHKPVDAFPAFPYNGAVSFPVRPSYVVGRTMFEADRVPQNWVKKINDGYVVNELWVPSQFVADAFYASGVKPSIPVTIIPEAIDTYFWDPQFIAPSPLIVGKNDLCPKCFRFFSNFKWEMRKGWDVLLTAYFKTFTMKDPVALYLKTYLYMDDNPRDSNRIIERIQEFARKKLDLDPTTLPLFVVLPEEVSARDMPSLYRAMDCFVLPTRGEGWGLPFQEAMAMALPTIGTNWGGNVDFMNSKNSLLLKTDGTEAADASLVGGARIRYPDEEEDDNEGIKRMADGKRVRSPRLVPKWAKPSVPHLMRLMRWVVDHPNDAREIGKLGRETIRTQFSRKAVMELLLARLQDIQPQL